jgi:prepilin-type N-terminal cleavage/methylation domain-containing protein
VKDAPRGFTLVEVLIVLGVTAIVLLMLDQGIRIAVNGTNAFHRAIETPSDMEPVERALRRMIERMDPGMYPDPPVVRGTAHAIVFTTELPDPANGGTLTADVRLETANGMLILWWTPHTRGVPFATPPPPHRMELARSVAGLDIAYAAIGTGAAWLSSWTQPAMPGLIRLRLLSADGASFWPTVVARPRREQAEQ